VLERAALLGLHVSSPPTSNPSVDSFVLIRLKLLLASLSESFITILFAFNKSVFDDVEKRENSFDAIINSL